MIRCTVNDQLLEAAQAALGTATPDETVELSLQRAVQAAQGPSTVLSRIETQVDLERWLLNLRQRPPPDGLARRRAALKEADRLRVKVGRQFRVAEIVRELRDRSLDTGADEAHGAS